MLLLLGILIGGAAMGLYHLCRLFEAREEIRALKSEIEELNKRPTWKVFNEQGNLLRARELRTLRELGDALKEVERLKSGKNTGRLVVVGKAAGAA